jgi:hypothetical protein
MFFAFGIQNAGDEGQEESFPPAPDSLFLVLSTKTFVAVMVEIRN